MLLREDNVGGWMILTGQMANNTVYGVSFGIYTVAKYFVLYIHVQVLYVVCMIWPM